MDSEGKVTMNKAEESRPKTQRKAREKHNSPKAAKTPRKAKDFSSLFHLGSFATILAQQRFSPQNHLAQQVTPAAKNLWRVVGRRMIFGAKNRCGRVILLSSWRLCVFGRAIISRKHAPTLNCTLKGYAD
jgi:hypothetical protein